MSTSQTAGPLTNGVLMEGIVSALSAHPNLTDAQRQERAREVLDLIASLQPADAIEVMLIGQCLVFNETIADASRDMLRGMDENTKLRAQSNLNGLNRSLHQNLNAFLRRREKAAAAEAAREAAAKEAAKEAAREQQPRPARKAPPAYPASEIPGEMREPNGISSPHRPPAGHGMEMPMKMEAEMGGQPEFPPDGSEMSDETKLARATILLGLLQADLARNAEQAEAAYAE